MAKPFLDFRGCLWQCPPQMAKDQFFIAASQDVLGHIDEAGRKAGLSRGQAFEDFLTFVRCSLAGQTMEEEYLKTVAKGYGKGKEGKRGIDAVVRGFATLVQAMEETGQDVLGDMFQGGITRGEAGQFFTPQPIADLMTQLTFNDDASEERKSICDPACGSGRFLLAIAKKHRHYQVTGIDVDHRCAQMAAINLGLNGLYGWAVWGNSLTLETHRVYKIGFHLQGGVIKEVPVASSPFNYAAIGQKPPTKITIEDPPQPSGRGNQLDLF